LSLLDPLEMVLPWHPIREGGRWLGVRTKEGEREGGREGSLYERAKDEEDEKDEGNRKDGRALGWREARSESENRRDRRIGDGGRRDGA
jgi:hypothetical protein